MGILLGVAGGWRRVSARLPGDASALVSQQHTALTLNPRKAPESCEYT